MDKNRIKKPIDIDSIPLSFGKYIDWTPNEIAEQDGQYVVWMYDNIKPKPCSKELRDACEQDIRDEDDMYRNIMFDGEY